MSDDESWAIPRVRGPLPARLARCRACGRHCHETEQACPHCGVDFAQLAREQEDATARALAALATLGKLFGD